MCGANQTSGKVEILLFEANIFNITNSVYFNAPATNINTANFGQVTSQRNLPRKVELNAQIF